MATFTIFTDKVEETVKKIARIANKCKKANVPFVFNVGESYSKPVDVKMKNGKEKTFILDLTDIEVSCQFKYNGWRSLGRVKRTDGIIQCYFEDASLIKEYRTTDFHCDHCRKNVYRSSVIILENEQGERKTIGTSCVEEFTQGLSGELIASYIDLTDYLERDSDRLARLIDQLSNREDDEETFSETDYVFFEGTRVGIGYDTEKVVSCASFLIRNYGFHTSCEHEATWKFIPWCMDNYKKFVTESDIEEAKSAISWILGKDDKERSETSYIFNLYQICKSEKCTMRFFGLLASLIPTYKKALVKSKIDEIKNISEYIGNVGEKIHKNVIITKIIPYTSMFGNGRIIIMKDKEGNVIKWNTSTCPEGISEGHVKDMTCTIKNHEEYRGEKQTCVVRCKFSRVD